ncbi:MAG: serine hydrolase [Acidobacteria bacterium]|nr:serine hydrolase [Acidobacteriota bacterium]
MREKIVALINASGATTVGVAFYDLATGATLLINADENFHAASTMKVPVMMELYRQAQAKKISLDDRIPIKNDFISIADGSHFSIDANSDSEATLYQRVGESETLRQLMRLMIDMSSNLATNLLIEKVGAKNVLQFMRTMGAKRIQVRRGVEDGKAFERNLNNTTTARDLMILLRRIAAGRAVSAAASEAMINIMLAQHFNEGIPAGVGKAAKVAHKTGSITKINHDAAIVFPAQRQPYVLVVLTRGFSDEKRAHQLIAEISRVIYEQLLRPSIKLAKLAEGDR